MKYLGQRDAQRVDEELMSSKYGFSIDQLMELAGLSVACAIGKEYPSASTSSSAAQPTSREYGNVLIVAGPGNNGAFDMIRIEQLNCEPVWRANPMLHSGDALVAARHLKHFGYSPTILYPKRSSKALFQVNQLRAWGSGNARLFIHVLVNTPENEQGLVTQCEQLEIPFVDQVATADAVDANFDLVLDGVFGFSFEGSIRAPFGEVISVLKECQTPIVSIDIPSGWHVEKGSDELGGYLWGNEKGVGLEPQMLVSLTAPKLCAQQFGGPNKTHYIGGRFVPRSLAEAFNLELPVYPGTEQCVKLD